MKMKNNFFLKKVELMPVQLKSDHFKTISIESVSELLANAQQAKPWSSLVEGDEGCIGPSDKTF